MTFATGPFGVGAHGLPTVTYDPTAPIKLVSSQKIGVSGDFVLDEDGNYVIEDDVMHNVRNLIAFGVKLPKLVGRDFEQRVRQQVIAALKPMTDSSVPIIRIDNIGVTSDRDTTQVLIEYTNLLSGKPLTLII